MNGTMGSMSPLGPPGLWQEARNADGRVYYYNSQTKETQWTKPLELMTPAERALANQPWKEYTAEGGRKYWYNTDTKQSSWEMPRVYKDALAHDQPPARPVAQAPTFVAGGTASLPPYQSQYQHQEPLGQDRQIGYGSNDVNGTRATAAGPQQTDPEYSSFEEAETAFMKLLRRAGVQPEWSWEQTMRAIIKDPQYKALKDPKDRKAAFEKYAVEVRLQENDRVKERMSKLKADFGTMLRSHPEIKHYTRWKTARKILEGETIFRSTDDDNERRQLFEDYVYELKKAEFEQEVATRKAAMDDLVSILKALDLEPYTRWSEAHGIIQSNPRFRDDQKFQSLSKSDLLVAFENHIKSLERNFNDARQQLKNSKARRERQNRDNFIALLRDLQTTGKIKAGTKWMQVHPLVEKEESYQALLGHPGSSPLDLFWDVVEEEERGLRGKRNEVLDVLDDKHFEIQSKTSFDEFMAVMESDARTTRIDPDALQLIFQRLHEKVTRRSEDDKHQAERHQRRAIDALRSKIKHLEPPIHVNDTWDQVRPRIQPSEEYRALESDDLRRAAFEKVLRRMKEKEEDAERDVKARSESHRREREPRDRSLGGERAPHGRDRSDRGDPRNGYPSSSHRSSRRGPVRPSRTPEPDAYEAERKKAQAERERQYLKASVTGLSPPPPTHHRSDRDKDRERDRERDRDRDRDRERDWGDRDRGPSSRGPHYDRERSHREEERERLYRSRGDPKGSRDELDYGGDGGRSSVGSGVGRRRYRGDSDPESVISRREPKRSRRDRTSRERSPPPAHGRDGRRKRTISPAPPRKQEPPKEEPAVHSGSEEGEIEEE
ncbi:MAG: hypothetical protein M1817_001684 [Caeruleum heppii]|nr:MAG: hypothetical protein M1817_001684 [Caeruleum heppii]